MSLSIWILSSTLSIKREDLSKAYAALESNKDLATWVDFGEFKNKDITELLNECGIAATYNAHGDLVEISLIGATIYHHELLLTIIAPFVEDKSKVIIGIETEEDWDYADIYEYKKKKLVNSGKKATHVNNKLVLKNIPKKYSMTSIPEQEAIISSVKEVATEGYNASVSSHKEATNHFKKAYRLTSKLNGPADWESYYLCLSHIVYYQLLSKYYTDAITTYNLFLGSDVGDYYIKIALSNFNKANELLINDSITMPDDVIDFFENQIKMYGISE